jgi:hypothetical protein
MLEKVAATKIHFPVQFFSNTWERFRNYNFLFISIRSERQIDMFLLKE